MLDLVLLRCLKETQDEKELSRMTNVDRKVITAALDELFEAGYIGDDSMITEQGFDVLNQTEVRTKRMTGFRLTELDKLLLMSVNHSMTDKSMSKLAKVDLATVSAKLDKLYDQDLITEDLALTKNGYNLLHQLIEDQKKQQGASQGKEATPEERASAPSSMVILQKEVVKIPCRYCGALLDPVRDAKCSSCGANLVMRR